jgi:uncharacterized UPF0160 family protein
MTHKEDNEVVDRFDKKFIQDNDPKDNGILYLFRVNADGSRSIALPDDIKQFLLSELKAAEQRVLGRVELDVDELDKIEAEFMKFGTLGKGWGEYINRDTYRSRILRLKGEGK